MSRVTLPSGTPAELVRPPSEPTRGVVLVPDIMGLRPLFDGHCARLAGHQGWVVCAVEPFPGREHLPREKRDIGSNADERVLADLVDAADLLGVGPAAPVAVLGFCQGGMWAFKAAATGRFDRAVAFYGLVRVPNPSSGHGQPLEYLARPGTSPVLAIAAGRDTFVPVDDVEELRRLPNVEVAFYPDAEHGFAHDPDRPAHRTADAADAWRRAIEFLS